MASGTNLLGLVTHLTFVERASFLKVRVDDWASTFHASPDETVDDVVTAYADAVRAANEVIDACPDLALPVARPRGGAAPSMRWTLVHMIEETGRHAGHADILREQIDGSTGR